MSLSAPPHAPIDSIPLETLICVFLETTRDPVELMDLALVCRRWRDIVFGTGELWSHIVIGTELDLFDETPARETSEGQVRKQLELSGETLLVLDIQEVVPIALAELALGWNRPRPIMERVTILKLMIPYGYRDRDDVSAWASLSAGHCWPQLKRLILEGDDSNEFCVHICAPNLEILGIRMAYFHDWSYIGLGSALWELQWTPGVSDQNVAQFWHVAAHCPNLRRLTLDGRSLALLSIPRMLGDRPLWLKLDRLSLECMRASHGEILSILLNAPHLTILQLRIWILVRSNSPSLPDSKLLPSLRKLSLDMFQTLANWSDQLLKLELLRSILDFYNPAALSLIHLSHLPIILCGIPALCPLLQDIQLEFVVVSPDFVGDLRQCPLLYRVVIIHCWARDNSPSGVDEHPRIGRLIFNGDTFTGCTQLQTLRLNNVNVYPEFVAKLSHQSHLKDVDLSVGTVDTNTNTVEGNWQEVEAIAPLPNLGRLHIRLSGRPGNPPAFSLNTPAAQCMISSAAQLARDMAKGDICLQSTPLRATDAVRLLSHPGRALSDIKVEFRSCRFDQDVISVSFTASVGDALPDDQHEPSFKFKAAIKMIELATVADAILDRFPDGSDIKTTVEPDEEALKVARMESRRNPDAAGLRYILVRVEATASNGVTMRGGHEL